MYGIGDDIAYYCEEIEKLKKLVSFAKDEIFTKIATSNLSVEERVELISMLKLIK